MPHPRLESVGEQEALHRFACEAVHGLAELGPDDLGHGNLTLPLGVSVWMRRGKVGLDQARAAMFGLRRAVLVVSGLDDRTEPVPLVVADPVAATISLAVYLEGLLERAATTLGVSRRELAERVVAHLGS